MDHELLYFPYYGGIDFVAPILRHEALYATASAAAGLVLSITFEKPKLTAMYSTSPAGSHWSLWTGRKQCHVDKL